MFIISKLYTDTLEEFVMLAETKEEAKNLFIATVAKEINDSTTVTKAELERIIAECLPTMKFRGTAYFVEPELFTYISVHEYNGEWCRIG